jgi:hypothetical protein
MEVGNFTGLKFSEDMQTNLISADTRILSEPFSLAIPL